MVRVNDKRPHPYLIATGKIDAKTSKEYTDKVARQFSLSYWRDLNYPIREFTEIELKEVLERVTLWCIWSGTASHKQQLVPCSIYGTQQHQEIGLVLVANGSIDGKRILEGVPELPTRLYHIEP